MEARSRRFKNQFTHSDRPVAPRLRSQGEILQIGDVQHRHVAGGLEESRVVVAGRPDDESPLADEHEIGVSDIVGLTRTGDKAERHERLFAESCEEVFGVEHDSVPRWRSDYSTAFPSLR